MAPKTHGALLGWKHGGSRDYIYTQDSHDQRSFRHIELPQWTDYTAAKLCGKKKILYFKSWNMYEDEP
jgi:hypothetical protein